MGHLLSPLLVFQPLILPTILGLLVWGTWRTVFRRDMAVGFGLYIALVVIVDGFYNTGIYLPGLQQGSIKYSEVCALILMWRLPVSDVPRQARQPVLALVTLYFLLLFIAALRAHPMLAGIIEFRKIAIPQIVAFALATRWVSQPAEYRRFLLALTVLAMIVAVFALWDVLFDRWILHSDMLYKPEYGTNRKNGRYGSILLNPNFLGAFVVLTFPPLFVQSLEERVAKVRIYLWIVMLGQLFCLIETQSRAPLLAFGGSLLVLVSSSVGPVSRAKRIGALAAGLALMLAVMPGFFEHASQRFVNLDNERTTDEVSRASVWEYTKGIIAEHPLAGIGFGEQQFLDAMEMTDFRERYGRQSLDNPHNSYLQAAVYAGIPAVIIFLLANLTLLRRSWVAMRHSPPRDPYAAAMFGLVLALAGFLLSIYPDMHLFTGTIAPLFWLCFGLLLAIAARRTEVHRRDATSGAQLLRTATTIPGANATEPTDVPSPRGRR